MRDVVGRLDRAGLTYMLTGSLALSYYAEPRMTRDIDLVVALTPGDAGRISALFAGEYYAPDDLASAIVAESFFNLVHLESVTKVDIMVRKRTPYRLLEFERRRQIRVDDIALWIVSKEDLMISKLEWARESRSDVQLRDVKSLAATGYDRAYVREWIGNLGLERAWKGIEG